MSVSLAALQPCRLEQRFQWAMGSFRDRVRGLWLKDEARVEVFKAIEAFSSKMWAKEFCEFSHNYERVQKSDSRITRIFAALRNTILLLTEKNLAKIDCLLESVPLAQIDDRVNSHLYPARCVDHFLHKLNREERAAFNEIQERHPGSEYAEVLKLFQLYLIEKVGPMPMETVAEEVSALSVRSNTSALFVSVHSSKPVSSFPSPVAAPPSGFMMDFAKAPMGGSPITFPDDPAEPVQRFSPAPLLLPPSLAPKPAAIPACPTPMDVSSDTEN
jgi:hypothetical protein